MKPTLNTVLAFAAALTLPSIAMAQDAPKLQGNVVESSALITDRPDFTESAATIEPGRFQLEGGITHERGGSSRVTSVGEVLARIGLTRRSELRVGIPSYLVVRDGGKAKGFDDASLGVKYLLSNRAERPVALLVGATLPTGSRRVAERKLQPEVVLATGMDLSEKVGLGLNLGYGRPSGSGVRFTQFFASASLGFSLTEKLGAFTEAFVYNRTEAGGRTQKYSDVGLTYGINDNLQVDARVGFGLWNRAGGPDYFYGVGIAQRF